jgi:hypothetical protein
MSPRSYPLSEESIEEIYDNIARTYVLVAAISEYEHMPYLGGPAEDIRMAREIFVDIPEISIYQDRYKELFNPSSYDFRETIINFSLARSARGDILIVYFSGHGAITGFNNFVFCLRDTAARSDDSGVLPLSSVNFRDVVQTLTSADVLPIFIIDACFSSSASPYNYQMITSAMQDTLHRNISGAYGLLASTSPESASFDTAFGGVFTRKLHSLVINGLDDDTNRHLPLLTLQNITSPLQNELATAGFPLSRSYLGPDLPFVPISRNPGYEPDSESFSPYMAKIVHYLWNEGKPREAKISEFVENIGPGAYANHSKLSLKPWDLLKDCEQNSFRELTVKGKQFAKGELSIPRRIIKNTERKEWVPDPETDYVSISEISSS